MRTFGRSRPLWSKIGILSLAFTCQSAIAQQIQVLSSRPDTVSGGDAVIQVGLPAGISTLQVTILRNGSDVTSAFVAADLRTLQGLVSGLNVGFNTLLATSRVDGHVIAKLAVQNWPLYGPVFAGAHQRPWICETQASGLGPPPASGPCVAPTRYDWFYRSTGGTFKSLPSLNPPFPSDLAQTTTIDGNTVNYIVRVESGTIDESIYRIAILDDPTNPISNPWSAGGKKPGPGWNGKLTYPYGPGAGPAFRSGSNGVTSALSDGPLRLGFAVAFGTRNTYGTGEDDVVSAETTSMLKEHFIKQYALPRFTIASGSSGGSIQQHYIAQNYPGLLDAITPNASFPDVGSMAASDVLDCQVLIGYFNQNTNPADWPGSRRALIDGYAVGTTTGQTTCQNAWSGLANSWQNPTAGFSTVVPQALRYNPITNPTGARGDYWDANVNSFGIDPVNGFARSAYDNIGVQYGLNALNSGGITKAEFLDLNEKIGGLDIDGNYVSHRSTADPIALQNGYRAGRFVTASGETLPIIDIRPYVDTSDTGQLSIHSRIRTPIFVERLRIRNGTSENQVSWITGGTSAPDLSTTALLALNEWLENIRADASTDPYATKVIRNKPAYLKDACWFNGVKYEEPLTLDPSAKCNQLMPIYGTVRLAAGGPLSGTTLKCQLKPVDVTDYAVTFTPAELVRLNTIFPQGVCDWTKPGVSEAVMDDSWLRFVSPPGTWTRMGPTGFGH